MNGFLRRRPIDLEPLEQCNLLTAVTTDLPDYAPARDGLHLGSGFQPGETVEFQVVHTDGTPNTGGGHLPWAVQDGSAADLDGVVDEATLPRRGTSIPTIRTVPRSC